MDFMSRRGRQKDLAKDKAVGVETINRYLATRSDFAFEMEILQIVKAHCPEYTRWGGVYYDSNTGKQREFDIRTELPVGGEAQNWLMLAIECKNIEKNYPLVVSCTKRSENEQTLDSWRWPMHSSHVGGRPMIHPAIFYRRWVRQVLCKDEFVGRELNRVGVDDTDNLVLDDEDVFNKWSQALNSVYGMLRDVISRQTPEQWINLIFLPIVVVPDGTLWQVRYEETGNTVGVPALCEHIPYWLGQEYEISLVDRSGEYKISELHFFTKSGLIDFFKDDKSHMLFFQ